MLFVAAPLESGGRLLDLSLRVFIDSIGFLVGPLVSKCTALLYVLLVPGEYGNTLDLFLGILIGSKPDIILYTQKLHTLLNMRGI